MSRLSNLARRLYIRSWVDGLLSGSEDKAGLIGELRRHGSAAVSIAGIVELVAHHALPISAAARDVICRRLGAVSLDTLRALDDEMRPCWKRPSALLSAQFVNTQSLPVPVLGTLTLHASGFVREAAVRRLGEIQDGSELPFIVFRWNDWVAPVREVSRDLLAQRLKASYAEHWFAVVPIVRGVTTGGRNAEQGWLLDQVTNLTRRPEARSALRRALASCDLSVRREAASIALGVGDDDRAALLRHMLDDADGVVRFGAAKRAATVLEGGQLDEALALMENDALIWVRREALYATLKLGPQRAASFLRRALLDRHHSMRHAARVYLRDVEPSLDARTWYRERIGIDAGHDLAAAVRGLGETGGAEDAGAILPLAHHSDHRVRAAAAEALGRLGRERHVDTLLVLLRDEQPSPSRAAREALSPLGVRLNPSAVLAALEPSGPPHVRRNAVRVLRTLHPFVRLPHLIRLAADLDQGVAGLARVSLTIPLGIRYLGWVRPDPEAQAAARAAYEQVRARVPNEVRNAIERRLEEIGDHGAQS